MGSFFPAQYSAMDPRPQSFLEILQGIIDAPSELASAARLASLVLGVGDRIETGLDANTDRENCPLLKIEKQR